MKHPKLNVQGAIGVEHSEPDEPLKPGIRISLTVEEILQMLAFVQNDLGAFRQLFDFITSIADRVDMDDIDDDL